ncbi:FixH family protein [Candidatus Jidaibacter acanthamoebae]|uniref:FixH family protein n=1 Tax=Candidatus Jidaibacter acanthamoebae TaxID=86105 RepID=UPI00057F67AE|nr:FixH family protein [Candidatus Jidaibacter acanthamoeba]
MRHILKEHAMETKKSIIPYLFIAFILLYVTLDSIFIYISKNSYNGIITENAYQKGLDYNQVIKENEAQKKLGWIGNLRYYLVGKNLIELDFTLFDKKYRPVKGGEVEVRIMRPVNDKYDMVVKLEEISSGRYSKTVQLPLQGQWEIKLKASVKNDVFFLNRRITISDKEQ